jgi:hypothetical protein
MQAGERDEEEEEARTRNDGRTEESSCHELSISSTNSGGMSVVAGIAGRAPSLITATATAAWLTPKPAKLGWLRSGSDTLHCQERTGDT